MRNYVVEGRIRDRFAGVMREDDLDLFITEYRNGDFDEADVHKPEWIEAQKKAKPHRFIGGTDEESELYRRAFV